MHRMAFLNRHIIGIGLAVVSLALLVILYVQYRSLSKLGEALPAARKAAISKRLWMIDDEIQNHYRSIANESLAVSPAIFSDHLADDFPALDAAVKAHFLGKPSLGIGKFFILTMSRATGKRVLSMYDPHTGGMLEGSPTPEGWAAFVAGSPWMTLLWRNVAATREPDIAPLKMPEIKPDTLVLADSDPDHPIILRPITNEASLLVGVAGLVIDRNAFRDRILPEAIRAGAERHLLGDEFSDLTLAAFDETGGLISSTRPLREAGAEMKIPFSFAFPRWHLGVRSESVRYDQIGRRYLLTNLSLSIFMTLIIIGGSIFALRAAAREMKLSQMKTDFVSNVSHELRTPLSSIRVFGELQRLGLVRDPAKVREYGEYIETESRRLTQLINNILDFSRIESDQKSYRFVQADLTDIVSDTLKTFEVRLLQDSFSVKVEAPDKPLPQTIVDPEAIGQVLVNLLDNAVKYSGEAREIRISLGHRFEFATVSVRDFGVGIPPEEREKIFERFHRVSTGLVHDVKGSGLGLSLVKHIVEAHGGRVTVQSELGRGSTFTVHLPVFDPAPQREQTPQNAGNLTEYTEETGIAP